MQIKEIVLYSYNKKNRPLEFNLGTVNIIKGVPSSGKTALVDIIEYCIGRNTCMIAEGHIRDKVSWYGILIQLKSTQIFVARKAPEVGNTRTNQAYFIEGKTLSRPETITKSNITFERLIKKLTEFLGIAPNLELSISSQMNLPQPVTIKNSLYYCFQQQDEIATKRMLFHRQSEKMKDKTIAITLPYFLGAIEENHANLRFQLERERRERYRLQHELKELESIKVEGFSRANGLISESKRLGLLSNDVMVEGPETYRPILEKAQKWKPDKITLPGDNELPQLQFEVRTLRRKLDDIDEKISETERAENELSGYENETEYQRLRLESIGLYDSIIEHKSQCPICEGSIDKANSYTQAIHESIKNLKKDLESASREKPNLRNYIKKLEIEKGNIKTDLNRKLSAVEGIIKQQEYSQKLKDLNMERGNVLGQIQFWLESVQLSDPKSELNTLLMKKNEKINEIEAQIDEEKIRRKTGKILQEIGDEIIIYAKRLQLEMSDYPAKIDLNYGTIIFNKDGRNIPFTSVGGKKNWVAYHVLTHLILHRYFRTHKRPVPRFLVLDEPSIVYKSDIELHLLNIIFEFAKELSPDFQLIVTEPEEFKYPQFQSYVKEDWSKKKLVPENWPDRPE